MNETNRIRRGDVEVIWVEGVAGMYKTDIAKPYGVPAINVDKITVDSASISIYHNEEAN